MTAYDVIIIGAGAAGLMCAIEAGKRGRRVLVLDHANKPGKKILMSGGGRCNFTNYHASPDNYLSHNPHFCKSALSRYTQWDFIALVKKHKIPFHEKTLGQLFCDNTAKDIVAMLLNECEQAGVTIRLNTAATQVQKKSDRFHIHTDATNYECTSLVIASGGLSIPTMGASPFAYKIAEQFNLKVWPTRAGLVPFTLHVADKEKLAELPGVSLDVIITCNNTRFAEAMLFTHRGLSGPAILQISSYWHPGDAIEINLLPKINLHAELLVQQQARPAILLRTLIAELVPKRVASAVLPADLAEKPLRTISQKEFAAISAQFHAWQIKPNGTEGYRTAEVTLGGVDCDVLSSKTMMVNDVEGLYFIGEAVDVTGWLGGYNFQWAWSSGWAAGQVC
jgi:predicted Rossmann fold flavoprotein